MWAFSELERQQEIVEFKQSRFTPVWRIDEINDEKVLRYMTADVAVSNGCVSCHNAFEQRPDIMKRRAELETVRS